MISHLASLCLIDFESHPCKNPGMVFWVGKRLLVYVHIVITATFDFMMEED